MAHTAPKEQWRNVRRYALIGDMPMVLTVLRKMQQNYPEDPEITAELQRAEKGLPLLCTETQKERKKRIIAETLHAMSKAIEQLTAKKLAVMHTEEISALHREFKQNLRLLADSKTPAPPGTNAFKRDLERELSKRKKKNVKVRSMVSLIALGVLLIVGGSLWALHRHAEEMAELLEKAMDEQDWLRTEAQLKATDTGINRLMAPRVNELTAKVRGWQQSCISRSSELSQQLQVYQRREAISTLSLEERADFMRRIRALPDFYSQDLMKRWLELCRPEQEKLDKQRDSILAEIRAAAVAPVLSGEPGADALLLKKAKNRLELVIQNFRTTTKDAFNLSDEIIEPNIQRLAQINNYLQDIESLTRAELQMRGAYNYSRHYSAFKELTANLYPPAIAAAKAGQKLPAEEEIVDEVRAFRFKIPRRMPQEVIRAIVERGPSFCPAYPANLQQLHLMEDIFTSRTLRQRLFELYRSDDEVHYTDDFPTVTPRNSAVFTLSELDPLRKVDQSPRCEWENASAVWRRTLDATPILKATGISRERFFLTANLPDMLGKLTSIHDENCPALAKAYVYHTLLEVMSQHRKEPSILGLRYAPTLREDIASFRQLMTRCKIQLSATCWLNRKSETLEAEKLCENWFAAHADRDYCAEMSQNLSRILRTAPRYIGYIDAQGKPRLRSTIDLSGGAPLWYLSDGKLITTPEGAPMQNPSPYSPIFTE